MFRLIYILVNMYRRANKRYSILFYSELTCYLILYCYKRGQVPPSGQKFSFKEISENFKLVFRKLERKINKLLRQKFSNISDFNLNVKISNKKDCGITYS